MSNILRITEKFPGQALRDAYRNVAPKSEDWALLIEKARQWGPVFGGWPDAEMRLLEAPLMVMLGNNDFVRPEHALQLFKVVPSGRISILPVIDQSSTVTRSDWVTAMRVDFFDAA